MLYKHNCYIYNSCFIDWSIRCRFLILHLEILGKNCFACAIGIYYNYNVCTSWFYQFAFCREVEQPDTGNEELVCIVFFFLKGLLRNLLWRQLFTNHFSSGAAKNFVISLNRHSTGNNTVQRQIFISQELTVLSYHTKSKHLMKISTSLF